MKRILSVPGAELALTSSDIWSPQQLPALVAVVGGVSTGCQLASILIDFGCQVTLLELTSRLIPQEVEDVSRVLEAMFRQKGMAWLSKADAAPAHRGHGRFSRDGTRRDATHRAAWR